jgi:hypothetical protein
VLVSAVADLLPPAPPPRFTVEVKSSSTFTEEVDQRACTVLLDQRRREAKRVEGPPPRALRRKGMLASSQASIWPRCSSETVTLPRAVAPWRGMRPSGEREEEEG